MTKEALLDKMQKMAQFKDLDRERASQILDAVEGMSIWKARELLETCGNALLMIDVHCG